MRLLGVAAAVASVLGYAGPETGVAAAGLVAGVDIELAMAGEGVLERPVARGVAGDNDAPDPAAGSVPLADVEVRRPTAAAIREAAALLDVGEKRFAAGDIENAAISFEGALDRLENLAGAHARLADIHLRTGRIEEGIRAGERALELDPTRVALYGTLGLLYAEANRPDAALECLGIVRELDALPPRGLKLLGMLNLAARRWSAAIEPFETHLEANPGDTDGWVRLADLYAVAKDARRMAAAMEGAVASAPANRELRHRLALAYADTGETTKALRHLLVLMNEEDRRGDREAPAEAASDLARRIAGRDVPPGAEDEKPAPPMPVPEAPAVDAAACEPASKAPEEPAGLPDRETVEKIIEAGQGILPVDPRARYVFYMFPQEDHRRKIAEAAGLAEGDRPLCVAAIASKNVPASDGRAILDGMVAEAERRGCRVRPVRPDVVSGLVDLGENRVAVAAVLLTRPSPACPSMEGP